MSADVTAQAAARVRDARRRLRARRPVLLHGPDGPVGVLAAQFVAAAPAPVPALGSGGPVGLALDAERWDQLGVAAGERHPRAFGLAAITGPGGRRTRVVGTVAAALDSGTAAGELVAGDAVRAEPVAPGGVRVRPDAAAAALDLVRGAGLLAAALLVPPGDLGGGEGDPISVEDVAEAAWAQDGAVRVRSRVLLPTVHGPFSVAGAETPDDGGEHVAMWSPRLAAPPERVVALSPCWAGHALGGATCGCGDRLRLAMREAAAGDAVLVHVGRPRLRERGEPAGALGSGCGAPDARTRGIAGALAGVLRPDGGASASAPAPATLVA